MRPILSPKIHTVNYLDQVNRFWQGFESPKLVTRPFPNCCDPSTMVMTPQKQVDGGVVAVRIEKGPLVSQEREREKALMHLDDDDLVERAFYPHIFGLAFRMMQRKPAATLFGGWSEGIRGITHSMTKSGSY